MILPHLTKTGKIILLLLYKFRFLTTNQIQKILNHKDPRPSQKLLKYLTEKKYIVSLYSRKKRDLNNKPAIFHLAAKARHILKKQKECELESLDLIYKEKRRKKIFIQHCLSLADIYIYFLTTKKKNEEVKFYTRTSLAGYEYFPDPKPDAFMAIKNGQEVTRYFIDLFDEYTPAWVYQQRIRKYIDYSRNGDWEANTKNSKFPILYFVCPNETKKMHVFFYGKAKLEKSFEEIELYASTINTLRFSKGNESDWLKVEEPAAET